MTNFILDKLKKLNDAELVSFHVPGHKSGKLFDKLGYTDIFEKIYKLDTTEIDETDNLHNAQEIIKYSQDKMAKIFNSDKSIFLVNGTTCGIEASIMSICKPKTKIITNRDCHQSVINACILGDIEPIYISSKVCPTTNIVRGIEVEEVKDLIDKNLDAKALVLTYPTYYGKTYDLQAICDYAHEKNIIVIVDEAHGAHLQLSDKLPKSAIEQGADIIIQSTHKTLGAFTQCSVLHLKGNRVDENKIKNMLSFLESSSPSYLFMISLEIATDIYDKYGKKLMNELLRNISYFKNNFRDEKSIMIDNEMDNTKLFISLKNIGITGYELDTILRQEYNIQVELSNFYGILLVCTIGNEKEDFDKLQKSLKDIIIKYDKKDTIQDISYPKTIPLKELNPREAFYSDKKTVKIQDSIGKVSGEYIIPYPPGISLVSPGEIITQEIITYIQNGVKNGMIVNGINDKNLEYIEIIDID